MTNMTGTWCHPDMKTIAFVFTKQAQEATSQQITPEIIADYHRQMDEQVTVNYMSESVPDDSYGIKNTIDALKENHLDVVVIIADDKDVDGITAAQESNSDFMYADIMAQNIKSKTATSCVYG